MKNEHSSLRFYFVKNDNSPFSAIKLIQYKQIISKALPNMDKPHIIRLLFDHRHQSLLAYQEQQIIGGACYALFQKQKFVELAFFAIRAENRSKGYGRVVMNKLKSVLQGMGIQYIITFGDNTAYGFFKKQGFSQKITMQKQIWQGVIKLYDGGKLMQCKIDSKIDYMKIDKIIKMQKQYVIQKIKQLSLNSICFPSKGLKQTQGKEYERITSKGSIQKFKRDPRTIPGVIQSGWTWQQHDSLKKFQLQSLQIRCNNLIQSIKRNPNSKYFLHPVSQHQVPNYYTVIKYPMDLQTISKKIKNNEYKNEEQICQDIDLIIRNCKQFNHPITVYYKSAVQLQESIKPTIQAFKKRIISTYKVENKQNL